MSLIKKKKISGKKSKRWRSIDVTDIMDGIETKHKNQLLEAEAKAKLKNKNLFFIDTGNEVQQDPRKAPLDPNRFKKKPKEIIVSKAEKKVVEKIAAKQKRKNEIQEIDDIPESTNESNTLDLWEDEPVPSKKIITKPVVNAPAVILPHPGQSYNPTFKSHKDLLQNVVTEEIEILKKKEYVEPVDNKPGKPLNQVKKKKFKSDIRRAHALAQEEKKIEKKKRQDLINIKSIVQEIDEKMEKQEKELEERRKKKEEEDKLIAEGKLIKARKVGKGDYEFKGTDFQTRDNLAPNLRNLNTAGNLLRDRFDSIFRRNLIEPKSNNRKRKSRHPKYKMHNIYDKNRRQEEEDDLKVHK